MAAARDAGFLDCCLRFDFWIAANRGLTCFWGWGESGICGVDVVSGELGSPKFEPSAWLNADILESSNLRTSRMY